MCGRFTLFASKEQIEDEFGPLHFSDTVILQKRYNIAPTQEVTAIIEHNGKRRLGTLHWGLIPSWSKDKKIASKLINARAETIAEKPSFKHAFQRRRCIIPASGFYEWKQVNGKKQPYFIYPKNKNGLFAFAGLWEKWVDRDGNALYSCTIVTTQANETLGHIHHRMPVILPKDAYSTWLDRDADIDAVKAVLLPFSEEKIGYTKVSTFVNSATNDDARCIEPM